MKLILFARRDSDVERLFRCQHELISQKFEFFINEIFISKFEIELR